MKFPAGGLRITAENKFRIIPSRLVIFFDVAEPAVRSRLFHRPREVDPHDGTVDHQRGKPDPGFGSPVIILHAAFRFPVRAGTVNCAARSPGELHTIRLRIKSSEKHIHAVAAPQGVTVPVRNRDVASFVEALQGKIEIIFIVENPRLGPGCGGLSGFGIQEIAEDKGLSPCAFVGYAVNGHLSLDKGSRDAFAVPEFGSGIRLRNRFFRGETVPCEQDRKEEERVKGHFRMFSVRQKFHFFQLLETSIDPNFFRNSDCICLKISE